MWRCIRSCSTLLHAALERPQSALALHSTCGAVCRTSSPTATRRATVAATRSLSVSALASSAAAPTPAPATPPRAMHPSFATIPGIPSTLLHHLTLIAPGTLTSTDESSKPVIVPLSHTSAAAAGRRRILRISGPEAADVVQNLTANDITITPHPVVFTAMLNHLGRVLADAFVFTFPPATKANSITSETEFLLDVDQETSVQLIEALQPFVRLADVDLDTNVAEWQLVQVFTPPAWSASQTIDWLHQVQNTTSSDASAKARAHVLGGWDPRLVRPQNYLDTQIDQVGSSMGLRLLLSASHPLVADSARWATLGRLGSLGEYDDRRYALGLAEGVSGFRFATSFPLESNFERLNGVHFNKGCYLGQELTHRSHSRGVTRKRILPFVTST
ncbi:hypothetical protein CAOG_008435 [Capsaspora owczarzaki ATCC 30864]|uniref:Uncharacterized protein n=2 Tax=Capsaspora owczarzaki (strain ATCC 30864) TaxID=595528 RepID=A0A0D2U1T6_CAPO3|nr:hypothetical protein CAOG_008435 [Capsaspora owczarzaki ATCC 30864]